MRGSFAIKGSVMSLLKAIRDKVQYLSDIVLIGRIIISANLFRTELIFQ